MNINMKSNAALSALLVAAVLATGGGMVYARGSGGENDAAADLAKAKVTLLQAIGAAEAHAGGRAAKAELESERGALVYQVEVVTADRKVLDVTVDAGDGKVVASKADTHDESGKDDKDD